MSTCNRLDLQTLGSPPVLPTNICQITVAGQERDGRMKSPRSSYDAGIAGVPALSSWPGPRKASRGLLTFALQSMIQENR